MFIFSKKKFRSDYWILPACSWLFWLPFFPQDLSTPLSLPFEDCIPDLWIWTLLAGEFLDYHSRFTFNHPRHPSWLHYLYLVPAGSADFSSSLLPKHPVEYFLSPKAHPHFLHHVHTAEWRCAARTEVCSEKKTAFCSYDQLIHGKTNNYKFVHIQQRKHW